MLLKIYKKGPAFFVAVVKCKVQECIMYANYIGTINIMFNSMFNIFLVNM